MQVDAYIGIGSNLENPIKQVKSALLAMDKIAETQFIKTSSFYRSMPLGPVEQPDFINAVVEVQTALPAETLLNELFLIEQQQGRERKIHWGPRTLDLDILLYGNQIINTLRLVVPHPQMYQREFVLFPLHEIAPDLCLPTGERIVDLCVKCDREIQRLEELV